MTTADIRPNITIFDCATQVQETRPMTDEEWDNHKAIAARSLEEQAERNAQKEAFDTLRTSARNKLVAGTPLTEEEAATLVI